MPYLNTPGGRLRVSKQIIGLIEKYGIPCDSKAEARPSKYVENGAEYHWFRNEKGEMVTKIRPLDSKKK